MSTSNHHIIVYYFSKYTSNPFLVYTLTHILHKYIVTLKNTGCDVMNSLRISNNNLRVIQLIRLKRFMSQC